VGSNPTSSLSTCPFLGAYHYSSYMKISLDARQMVGFHFKFQKGYEIFTF